jgi:hypothetical protein
MFIKLKIITTDQEYISPREGHAEKLGGRLSSSEWKGKATWWGGTGRVDGTARRIGLRTVVLLRGLARERVRGVDPVVPKRKNRERQCSQKDAASTKVAGAGWHGLLMEAVLTDGVARNDGTRSGVYNSSGRLMEEAAQHMVGRWSRGHTWAVWRWWCCRCFCTSKI